MKSLLPDAFQGVGINPCGLLQLRVPISLWVCCPLYVVCLKSREEEQGIQLNCI